MRADTWAVTVLLVWPVGVAGQVDRLVGPIVGYSINHQMWKPEAESDGVGGPMVGIRVETGTPVAGLAGTLELVYTQRGGDVDTTGEGAFEGAVRSDYLCLSLRPTLRFGVGPVALHIGLGPAMDMLVRSRIAPASRARSTRASACSA